VPGCGVLADAEAGAGAAAGTGVDGGFWDGVAGAGVGRRCEKAVEAEPCLAKAVEDMAGALCVYVLMLVMVLLSRRRRAWIGDERPSFAKL